MSELASPERFGFLIAASAVAVLHAVFTWRERATSRHGGSLTLVMLALAEVLACYAFSFSSALTFDQQVVAIRLTYVGWLLAPISIVLFVSWLTGRDRWIRPWTLATLAGVALFFAVVIFGPWSIDLFFGGGFDPQTFAFPRRSPLYVIFYAWTYALLTTAVVIIVMTALRSRRLHRHQIALVLVAILVPWLLSSLSFSNIRVLGIGPAVLSLIPTMFAFFAVFSFRSFDLRPMTREESYLASETGVVVVDERGRVSAMNPSAVRLLGPGRSPANGLEVEEVWSDRPAIVAALRGAHVEDLTILSADRDALLRFDSSPLTVSPGRRSGRLIVIRPEPLEVTVDG